MITLTRATARGFRALLRRTVLADSPRGPWPAVLASPNGSGLTLWACGEEVGLGLALPAEVPVPAPLAFPGELLARIEGAGDGPVTLEATADGHGLARWQDRGLPRSEPFDPVDLAKAPARPEPPRKWSAMPAGFLRALDDACRTAARAAARYALNRVQFRGRQGQLVATNGHVLLVQGGLPLPFAENVLVPALPAFGARELAEAGPAKLGRTKDRLFVRVGPWEVVLGLDANAKFPDAEGAIPKGDARTRLTIDEADAVRLLDLLPALPGDGDKPAFVTLDVAGAAVVRAAGDGSQTEVVLSRSRGVGPPARLCLDRAVLARALRLGFRNFEFFEGNKPLVAREAARLLVVAPLGETEALPPRAGATRITTADGLAAPATVPERRDDVTHPETNGRSTSSAGPPELPDPQEEAEALRAALQDAATRAGRLVASLRQMRRTRRSVESALAALRGLNLNP